MKKTLIALLLWIPLSAFAAKPEIVILDVQNMTCPTCTVTIRKALEKTPGVIEARVDYDHKTATVKYDSEKTRLSTLLTATTDAGFPSKLHSGVGK
jgi:mercuric ion binding protein